jgi:tetratricopeptide (TPR) repeat protein
MRLIKFILAIVLIGSAGLSRAQSGKYGATADDSVKCVENLSVYKDFLREKNFKKAKSFWTKAFTICPKSSLKMYVDGEDILEGLIKENKDNKQRVEELTDTLMLLFDVRIEHFGKEGYVLGKKGAAQYKARRYAEAYETLNKSIELDGNETQAAAMIYFFQAAIKLDKDEPKTPDFWVGMFNKCITICDHNIQQGAASGDMRKVKAYTSAADNIIKLADPYIDCDVLIGFFNEKYSEKGSDEGWLKSVAETLEKNECTNDPLYFKVANELHKKNPSAASARSMGIMSVKQAKYTDAVNFFTQAIDLADDVTDDANLGETLAELEILLAKAYFGNKNYSAARTHARNAAGHKDGWGEPYMLIGDLYAGSVSMCNEDPDGPLKSPYWVAVDMYAKAKSVDPSVASEASQKIAKYSQYFPTKSDAFFYGVTDGSDYTIKCWINAVTKARLR